MNKVMNLFFFLFCSLTLASCSSYRKIPYFQNLDRTTPAAESITNYSPLTIQPEDILGINISSLNPEASAVFNNDFNTKGNMVNGYLVDQKGEIRLPLIGILKVGGFTTGQVREQLQKKLTEFLKEPVVSVRVLNFKVSVMGDVGRPGVYEVQNERITMPEAITMAGDLNITALREKVLLIREQNGRREYIPVDLTSKKIFNSPYYYLKSNDVIYIQPGRTKYSSVDNSHRNISLILSALSIVAIVLTRSNY